MRTPVPSWNRPRCLAGGLLLVLAPVFAQQQPGDVRPAAQEPAAGPSGDTLGDALSCRSEGAGLPNLLPRLRRERPAEFRQTDRQYMQPMMDLYRLQDPVQAWGNIGDAVAITQDRVMLAVRGNMEEVSQRIDQALEDSRAAPLPGVLDGAHALVVYPADLPGLENMVLLGCEYRIEGLALLDDPADAWRKPRLPAGLADAPPGPAKPEAMKPATGAGTATPLP